MTYLKNKRILLTGATGGIGTELVQQLLPYHCQIGVVGTSDKELQQLSETIIIDKKQIHLIRANITDEKDQQKLINEMQSQFGGIDILINMAGIMDFTDFLKQSNQRINDTFQVNVIAPMQLCKTVIPLMLEQKGGHIVNIGSTFGSIGFAWFTTYSSTKFALRGFSQALRRELADQPIKVSYIAPRAVKTALNSSAVYDMAKQVKMNMDSPELVAKEIIKAIKKTKKECYIGFPENLFARINGIFPSLVDKATQGQNKISKKYIP